MANAFLGGMQAARQNTLTTLKMEDAISTLKARRQQGAKAERLQNYLGMYQKAAPGEKAGLEGQIAGEFPERAQKMREFRTSGEADLAEKVGGYAAVASRAIGTPEEPQAMLWLAKSATEAGVPPDQVKQAFAEYQADPSKARLIIDGMMVEGMGGAEYLKQYETPADVSKGERATRLEKLKQKNKLALEKVKQAKPGQRKIIKAADGYQYFADTRERVFPDVKAKPKKDEGRKTAKAADGRMRYLDTGELVFPEVEKAPGKPTQRDQKIDAAMTDYGITRKQAQDIVDGRIKVKTDPVTGQNHLVNVATGTSTVITPAVAPPVTPDPAVAPAVPEIPAAPAETAFDMLGEGVGFGAVFKEGLSVTAGQVTEEAAFTETTKARTKIKGLREKLIRALSLSGRPPVVEQERLAEMLPSTGIFESKAHATAQLRELHGALSRQVMEDAAFAKDMGNPKKLRIEAANRVKGITSMLRELGNPPPEDQGVGTTPEDLDLLNKYPAGG